jgi:hypothetical protein
VRISSSTVHSAQRERRFGDQLGRARADHVDAETLVVLLVGDDLDEALGLAGHPARPSTPNWNEPICTS